MTPTNQDSPNAAGAVEPVAWIYTSPHGDKELILNYGCEYAKRLRKSRWTETPLYTHPPENPPQRPSVDDEEEAYKLGKEDGYSEAVQWIDERTGGDGEYFASTIPGHGCPGPVEMRERIVERFNALSRPSVVPDEAVDVEDALELAEWMLEHSNSLVATGMSERSQTVQYLRQGCATIRTLTASLQAIRAQAVAEEMAKVVAWLRKQSSTGLFFADAIEQGAHNASR